MIYNIGSTIELVGQEADNFLEASGITIRDDEIIIEDAVVEFDAAIEHLAENGISLYEDCIILEGKQAEEYKARKKKEQMDTYKKDRDREKRRTLAGNKDRGVYWTGSDFRLGSKDDDTRNKKVDEMIDKERDSRRYEHDRAFKIAYNRDFNDSKANKKNRITSHNLMNFDVSNVSNARDSLNRHMRRHPKQYAKNESTIFDSVELTGIDEQVFFRYKKDSQGLLHAEAKKLAGIVNGIDLSDDSHLSKYGIHIDKIEYADDSFILRRKFNVKIHFGYDYKIKSEDIDYEVVEKLMDAILAKAGYRKYGRYSVKKGNGYLFAIDYQDIYIEESDQYYTVNYGTGDMPMTSGMTSRAHTPEQRYIDIDIKCIEDTPGNMSLLRK